MVMKRLAPTHDFKSMGFGVAATMKVGGMDCFVARCGYTGWMFFFDPSPLKRWLRHLRKAPRLYGGSTNFKVGFM